MNWDTQPTAADYAAHDAGDAKKRAHKFLELLREQNEIVGRALENAGMATLHAYNKSLSERIEEEMKK